MSGSYVPKNALADLMLAPGEVPQHALVGQRPAGGLPPGYKFYAPEMVSSEQGSSMSSGFLYGPDGAIVTSAPTLDLAMLQGGIQPYQPPPEIFGALGTPAVPSTPTTPGAPAVPAAAPTSGTLASPLGLDDRAEGGRGLWR